MPAFCQINQLSVVVDTRDEIETDRIRVSLSHFPRYSEDDSDGFIIDDDDYNNYRICNSTENHFVVLLYERRKIINSYF